MKMLQVVRENDSKHFRDRLYNRYGILLSAAEMWDVRRIEKVRVRVCHQNPKHSIGYMKIKGVWTKVVFDPQDQGLVTVMAMNPSDQGYFLQNMGIRV